MNITLIGMAGVGKSVIGRALARRLRYACLDIDGVIRKRTGMHPKELIDTVGEEGFLELEERVILELKLNGRSVVSPGGSVVYSYEAMKFLKKHSLIIFLDTSFKNINVWIRNKKKRGIIDLKKGLRKVYYERRPLYKKYGDVVVNLRSGYSVDSAVKRIIRLAGLNTGKKKKKK